MRRRKKKVTYRCGQSLLDAPDPRLHAVELGVQLLLAPYPMLFALTTETAAVLIPKPRLPTLFFAVTRTLGNLEW